MQLLKTYFKEMPQISRKYTSNSTCYFAAGQKDHMSVLVIRMDSRSWWSMFLEQPLMVRVLKKQTRQYLSSNHPDFENTHVLLRSAGSDCQSNRFLFTENPSSKK